MSDTGRYSPGYVSLVPPAPEPGSIDRRAPVLCSWDKLREAIRARFYPAIVSLDEGGQERVDRATDAVVALVMGTPPAVGLDTAWESADRPMVEAHP